MDGRTRKRLSVSPVKMSAAGIERADEAAGQALNGSPRKRRRSVSKACDWMNDAEHDDGHEVRQAGKKLRGEFHPPACAARPANETAPKRHAPKKTRPVSQVPKTTSAMAIHPRPAIMPSPTAVCRRLRRRLRRTRHDPRQTQQPEHGSSSPVADGMGRFRVFANGAQKKTDLGIGKACQMSSVTPSESHTTISCTKRRQ